MGRNTNTIFMKRMDRPQSLSEKSEIFVYIKGKFRIAAMKSGNLLQRNWIVWIVHANVIHSF
jgi:hypothetical protein